MSEVFSRRRSIQGLSVALSLGIAQRAIAADPTRFENTALLNVFYKTQKVGDVNIFYREAGAEDLPVVLLLHGFPTTSHLFRNLIPQLASHYRVIAPDLPGFGLTTAPPRGQFDYTFDNLAAAIDGLMQALSLTRYAIYIFDYGAPVGLRLAAAHPERVTAIISQSGNTYVEGLSSAFAPYEAYWNDPSAANRNALRTVLTPDATRAQYFRGANAARVSPDGYTLDIDYFTRPGTDGIQLDLIYDYRTNVALYPSWQRYLRTHQPPLLAVWGKNDLFFLPAGALAFRRDLQDAEIHFLDTGHFALETHGPQIAKLMLNFLGRHVPARTKGLL